MNSTVMRGFRAFAPRTNASIRFASTAPSPVTSLTQLEARWSKLPQAEQGAIADVVTELQKGDWKKMTLEQKRAGMKLFYFME